MDNQPTKYDSTAETLDHIAKVRGRMAQVIIGLRLRSTTHDNSKLHDPEKAMFDEYVPKLKALTYGSREYEETRREMLKNALGHHYLHNSHHPEHFENGVEGMSLLDLIEMFVDWKAATEKHLDGDFSRSLVINANRFGLDPQLAAIFENTRIELGW